jgi:hypothetical protein
MSSYDTYSNVFIDPPGAGGGGHLPPGTVCVETRDRVKLTATACGVTYDPVKEAYARVWLVSVGDAVAERERKPASNLLGFVFVRVGTSASPEDEADEAMSQALEMVQRQASKVEATEGATLQ